MGVALIGEGSSLIGHGIAGKSSLCRRFLDDRFTEEYFSEDSSTLCPMHFCKKTMEVDGVILKLQIWDLSGATRYKSHSVHMLRWVDLAIAMYDITNKENFFAVEWWCCQAKLMGVPSIALVGNKSDLEHSRAVSVAQAEAYAVESGLTFCGECSAKTGKGVQEVFRAAVRSVLGPSNYHVHILARVKVQSLEGEFIQLREKSADLERDLLEQRRVAYARWLQTVVQRLIAAHQRLCFAKGLHERLGCDSWVYNLAPDVAYAVFEQIAISIHSTFMGTNTLCRLDRAHNGTSSHRGTTIVCTTGETWHVHLLNVDLPIFNLEGKGVVTKGAVTGLTNVVLQKPEATRSHCVIS